MGSLGIAGPGYLSVCTASLANECHLPGFRVGTYLEAAEVDARRHWSARIVTTVPGQRVLAGIKKFAATKVAYLAAREIQHLDPHCGGFLQLEVNGSRGIEGIGVVLVNLNEG